MIRAAITALTVANLASQLARSWCTWPKSFRGRWKLCVCQIFLRTPPARMPTSTSWSFGCHVMSRARRRILLHHGSALCFAFWWRLRKGYWSCQQPVLSVEIQILWETPPTNNKKTVAVYQSRLTVTIVDLEQLIAKLGGNRLLTGNIRFQSSLRTVSQ